MDFVLRNSIFNSILYSVDQKTIPKHCQMLPFNFRTAVREKEVFVNTISLYGSFVSKHRREMHLTQSELCEILVSRGFNISNKAVSSWESGHTAPPLDTFFELCRIFKIEDVYSSLYGSNPFDSGNKHTSSDTSLSSLAGKYASLNAEGKSRADEYIGFLCADSRFTEKTPAEPIRIPTFIRLYDIPVSAGTGNFLEESTYEEVERTKDIPETASFGVRISGDSMEPVYRNGQTVWVKQQNTLENGDTGIFLLDGNAYCKKLRKSSDGIFLVSLNKAYSPIPVVADSNLIIFGKVL